MKHLKKLVKKTFLLTLLALVLVWGCHYWISYSTQDHIYNKLAELPNTDVAVVLGTSKSGPGGGRNLFFEHRLNAAARLYQSDKVKHFILSGDNRHKSYDEPNDMKKALIKRGVPAAAITLDYAGFRTFDSMIRAKEVFGQSRFVVISQKFHNQRAIYIARHKGIEAIGFNAKSISLRGGLKTFGREYLARVKALLDVHILGTKPKFLGEKVEIVL